MICYVDVSEGREIVAVELREAGASLGWVAPDDWLAYLQGDLDKAGLLQLARLQPEPPATKYRWRAPATAERVDTDDPTGYDAGRQ